MDCTILQNELIKVVSLLQGIMSQKGTMPVLGHLLFVIEKGAARVSASDLTVSVTTPLPEAVIRKEGRICIPGKKFFEVVRELSGDIGLSRSDKQQLVISWGNSRFKLACLPANEFPTFPAVTGNVLKFTLPRKTLLEMIRKTAFAAAVDDKRYAINSVLFDLNGKTLTVVATDGHRLSLTSTELSEELAPTKIIIGLKAIGELKKFLGGDGNVDICIMENQTLFVIDKTQFFARAIAGNYPEYRQVIPRNDKIVSIDREELNAAVRRVSLLNRDLVKFAFTENSCALSSCNRETGEGRDTLAAEYAGEAITINFNGSYVLDALSSIEGEKVKLALQGPLTPSVFSAATDDRDINVIMPVRD